MTCLEILVGRWQFPWELSSAEWTLLILNTKVCAAQEVLLHKKNKFHRGLLAQDLVSVFSTV